jgi:Pyridoxamine 5'-phosphate oxidase
VTTLSDAEREFLENPFVGVVTTLQRDGSPQSTVVWSTWTTTASRSTPPTDA